MTTSSEKVHSRDEGQVAPDRLPRCAYGATDLGQRRKNNEDALLIGLAHLKYRVKRTKESLSLEFSHTPPLVVDFRRSRILQECDVIVMTTERERGWVIFHVVQTE